MSADGSQLWRQCDELRYTSILALWGKVPNRSGYQSDGNTETYALVGDALDRAMIELIKRGD
ncbi:MAG: hypothetical protein O2857_13845 [Planctomycetota bacterium]|nr:hypothetical protein [Planctomycetota bacterium]